MLPRPITRSLRTLAKATAPIPCRVCRCRCGAVVTSNGGAPRRPFQTKRPAPSTTEDRSKPVVYTEAFASLMKGSLGRLHRIGSLKTQPESALAFLAKFESIARGPGVTADVSKSRALIAEYGMSEEDLMQLAAIQVTVSHTQTQKMGKKLMLTLSRIGIVDASIRIMAEAVLQAKKKPRILDVPETKYAREHLAKVANTQRNFRAMVLEGKVARLQGDEERAIEMWTNAMAEAVKAAEGLPVDEKTLEERQRLWRHDPLELSSPWIELMLIHWERTTAKGKSEMDQCEWAMRIGCHQDDPLSHYYASTFLKHYDQQGNHLGTSEWLYHITKAASSGHPKAAYELGVFYAESGWKYIEDEPADHVKPTPFDSYPASTQAVAGGSVWDRVRAFSGLTSRPETKPHESLFHNAVFPQTAVSRQRLAYMWMNVATTYTYAPAFLFRARMLLSKELWAGAEAPKAALNLSKHRYTFASKEDHDAGIPIEKPVEQAKEDPPNPFYNPEAAKMSVRQVFFAHEALNFADQAREWYKRSRRAGRVGEMFADDDELLEEHKFTKLGVDIQKWFRFPEIREMYEDDIEDLYIQAKQICDQQGWDLYDDNDGLIYKAGSGKKRKPIDLGLFRRKT